MGQRDYLAPGVRDYPSSDGRAHIIRLLTPVDGHALDAHIFAKYACSCFKMPNKNQI